MPEITQKLTLLLKRLDKLLDEGAKVLAAAKEVKDSISIKKEGEEKEEA